MIFTQKTKVHILSTHRRQRCSPTVNRGASLTELLLANSLFQMRRKEPLQSAVCERKDEVCLQGKLGSNRPFLKTRARRRFFGVFLTFDKPINVVKM